MPPQLLFTRLLNQAFAGPVDRMLAMLHIPAAYPQAPINNAISMELLVFGVLLIYFVAVRSRLR